MPIDAIETQRALRRLGKIRMGAKKTSSGGKEYPAKLEHWRITSPSRPLLEAAAAIYGGQVTDWPGSPDEGNQYQLFTTSDTLQVLVPVYDAAFAQSMEMWSAGGCVRRCTGSLEELTGGPCLCPPDVEERQALAAKGQACKMTTRFFVMLPDIPDIGTWMLETHGWYGAVELAGAMEIIRMAAGRNRVIPAQLRMEQRTAKRNGETRRYVVPVLELLQVTSGMLMTGEAPRAALGNGAVALEMGSDEARGEYVRPAPVGPTARPLPPLPGELEVDGGGGQPAQVPPSPPDVVGVGPGASSDGDGPTLPLSQSIAMACREAGLDDDGRHRFLRAFSNGAYWSSNAVPADKVAALKAKLVELKRGSIRLVTGEFDVPQLKRVDAPKPTAAPTLTDSRDWAALTKDVKGVGPGACLRHARQIAGEWDVKAPSTPDEITGDLAVAVVTWLDGQR